MNERLRFYLVQRLEHRVSPEPSVVGFDRHFLLEYMGSAEFEWGAIPKALQSIRGAKVTAEAVSLTFSGVTRDVYVVTHKRSHQPAAEALQAWGEGTAHRPPFWGKEATHFDTQFAGVRDQYDRTVAWWSIEDNVAFALDAGMANELVKAFNAAPEKKR